MLSHRYAMGPPIPSDTPSSTLSDDVWPFFFLFSSVPQHPYEQDHREPRLCFWKSMAGFLGSTSAKPLRDHSALATEAHQGCPSLIQPSQMSPSCSRASLAMAPFMMEDGSSPPSQSSVWRPVQVRSKHGTHQLTSNHF